MSHQFALFYFETCSSVGFVILELPRYFCSAPENWVVLEAAAMLTAMATVMAAANVIAMAVTTAVAAEISIASDSYVEGRSVLDAAAGR